MSGNPDIVAASELETGGALNKWWKFVLTIAWLFFIAYEICIRLDQLYSSSPLCPFSDQYYDAWYWHWMYLCLGGFIMVWLVLVWRLFSNKISIEKIPLCVAFHIVSIGTIATILALFNWGGMCVDVLNVASPGSIWGEWIACGPLLVFITVTVSGKPDVSGVDWFLMISFSVSMIAGFFIIIPQSYCGSFSWSREYVFPVLSSQQIKRFSLQGGAPKT